MDFKLHSRAVLSPEPDASNSSGIQGEIYNRYIIIFNCDGNMLNPYSITKIFPWHRDT